MSQPELDAASPAAASDAPPPDVDPSTPISLRALVSSKEAGIIIGRGGQHVAELRQKTGVKAGVSKVVPRVHRVLTVTGPLEAVAQAFGIIAQSYIDQAAAQTSDSTPSSGEAPLPPTSPSAPAPVPALHPAPVPAPDPTPVPAASDPVALPGGLVSSGTSQEDSSDVAPKTTTVRILISHALMGAVIGKQGVTIKAIQEGSGTRMVASKEMLPNSTERVVDITGPAEAIQKAIFEVAQYVAAEKERAQGTILFDPDPDSQIGMGMYMSPMAYGARGLAPHGSTNGEGYAMMGMAPGLPPGMGIPLSPLGGGMEMLSSPATASYAAHIASLQHQRVFAPTGIPAGSATSAAAVATAAAQGAAVAPGGGFVAGGVTGQGPMSAPAVVDAANLRTQNIAIPADMVGCIIGKGGSKITEIRRLSGSRISIAKVAYDSSGDRLFTIQGTPASNEKALYLLYNQLETEKERRQQAAAATTQEPSRSTEDH